MLKLKPIFKEYIWGGTRLKELFGRDNGGKIIAESWEVSVHPDGESFTEEGTLREYLAANPEAGATAEDFPVLIKYIDAAQNLSVQVHPNDDYARRVEGDNGKTEGWYILAAEKGAGIYCGFRQNTSAEALKAAIEEGRVESMLNFIPVKQGEFYLIKAGTVHAIGAGCVICEVQESSNVTYRVYDYCRRDAEGKLRPLHIDKALKVIDFRAYRKQAGGKLIKELKSGRMRTLTDCQYFRLRELKLNGTYSSNRSRSFLAVNILSGRGYINGTPYTAGDSFFIPHGEGVKLDGEGTVLMTDEGRRKHEVLRGD